MEFENEFERALALHRQGKLREAFLRYDAIVKVKPRHAEALHYSGVVLHQAGQHPAAAERIRAALDVDPTIAEAWSNLAMVLEAVGRPEAALDALKEAVRCDPGSAHFASNLAGMLIAQERLADAETAARQAVDVDPQHAHGWYNLAIALERQDRILEALDAVSRALALAPQQVAFAGLKAQLETRVAAGGRARATLEAALVRNPTSAALRFEYANLLENAGEPLAARDAYAQAVRLDPDHGAALSQLIFLKRWLADWHGLEELEQQFRAGVANGRALLSPFVLLGQPSTRDEQRRCAEAWSAALAGRAATTRRPLAQGRLRVGYLSADFHTHATAFLAAGLFEHHDRKHFDVTAFSIGPDDQSTMRARLRRAFDRFIDLRGAPPEAVAARIRDERIDLLIDLKGHTAGAPPRILALRPAPVQAHYLGFPGTLGGGLVDYLIGDATVTPPAHADSYGETLVTLPGSYQVNDRARPIHAAPSRSELGLPEDAVVLCNFNATWKLRPAAFDAWATVLRRVPNAVLWLLARSHDDPSVAHLRAEAKARGIDPTRLVFATARPNADYLGLYARADLFVDSWPYNAHTTGSDALWAGCPVVTIAGDTFASRVGASLSLAVGLPELVANDVEDYVNQIVALALDADARARLRDHLAARGRASALFDTERTTRALERAYLAMAEQYRRGVRQPIDLTL
ncbi:MAG TPA: tetratricopeptide repeat protein [Casimicrobiaceae bacterium]|nr:tetratricopeptide repeat protein [Casimicrobiaceae bacterium]